MSIAEWYIEHAHYDEDGNVHYMHPWEYYADFYDSDEYDNSGSEDSFEMESYKSWEEFFMGDNDVLCFDEPNDEVQERCMSQFADLTFANCEFPKYEELFSLAEQLLQHLSAWKARMERVGGDWNNLEQRKDFIAISKGRVEDSMKGDRLNIETELWRMKVKEANMTAKERIKYSVGRLMKVLGNREAAVEFTKEVNSVKRVVHNQLLEVLSPCLPRLPYTVMIRICDYLVGPGLDKFLLWGKEGPHLLLARRYITRGYETMVHLYKGVREVMFMHAMETSAPWYPCKFRWLRSRLVNTVVLLETLHGTNKNSNNRHGNLTNFYTEHEHEAKVLKEDNYDIEQNHEHDIKVHKEINWNGPLLQVLLPVVNMCVFSSDHLLLPVTNHEGGPQMAVQDLATGHVKKFPLIEPSVLEDLMKEGRVSLCTPLALSGNFVAISFSLGYPRSHVTSRDIILVFNWVEQKLVWQLEVPHSPQLREEARRMEDEYELDEILDDSDIDDLVNSRLGHIPATFRVVLSCSENGSFYLAHCETVGREGRDLKKTVKIYKRGVDEFILELDGVVVDFHHGLLIYKQWEEESDRKCVTTCWLDIESGKEISKNVLHNNEEEILLSISRLPGTRSVLEFCGDTLSFFSVDKGVKILEKELSLQTTWGGILTKISLVGENLLYMSSEGIGPSPEKTFCPMTRHQLVDLNSSQLPLADLFVVEHDFNGKDGFGNDIIVHKTTEKVVAHDKKLTLLTFLPDNRVQDDKRVAEITELLFDQKVEEVLKRDWKLAMEALEEERLRKERETQEEKRRLEVRKRKYEEEKIWMKRRSKGQGEKEDQLLKLVGERHTGVLVNWMDTYGFIQFDNECVMKNIFVHISDIRKSRRFGPVAGKRLEFVVGFDENKRKTKAISAEIL